MTLKDQIESDAAAGGVWLETDSDGDPSGFNEALTFYPEYDPGRKVTTQGIVVDDHLEGTREAHGDGVVRNDRDGRRIRQSVVIELPQTVDVQVRQPSKRPDVFVDASGTVWQVKQILGQDPWARTSGMQAVLCVRMEDGTVRSEARTG
jgi:hypothetical protein